MRVVCCLLLLLASQSALAEGFISRLLNHPVPGGVAVVPLKGIMAREISALDKACDGVDVDEVAALLRKADQDPAVRANRYALLAKLRDLFLGVADISVLG